MNKIYEYGFDNATRCHQCNMLHYSSPLMYETNNINKETNLLCRMQNISAALILLGNVLLQKYIFISAKKKKTTNINSAITNS